MCDFCGVKMFRRPKPSIQFIALNSRHIRINNLQILRLGIEIVNEIKCERLQLSDFPDMKHTPGADYPNILDWLFVVNLLNFGFCKRPFKPRWTFQNRGGYLGICAAVTTAIRKGYDIVNPAFYCNIPQDLVETIFCGDNNVPIPMAYERMKALHSAGSALIRYFNGTFVNCVVNAKHSALQLVNILVRYFEYFCDKAYYNGFEVIFHRKAQLLTIDIWVYYKNAYFGQFYDIDQLATTTTPLQLQQLFLYFNIFEYSRQLQNLTASLAFLESGCREEVEIRGCTIYVEQMLRNLINENIGTKRCVNPTYVSTLLSRMRKQIPNRKFKNIFHYMTKSIYY